MKKRIILAAVAVVLLLLLIWGLWTNKALEVNTYVISSDRLPGGFDGYRIAQVSDLHNDTFGQNNEKLLTMLAQTNPDMIAITGDLIDSRNTKVEIALDFAREAVKIAPCYYVTGNHEARISEYEELKNGLLELGVVVLDDIHMKLERNGDTLSLLGINDPGFQFGKWPDSNTGTTRKRMEYLAIDESYSILLSHQPELMGVYAQYHVDLVLCGHIHGGQIRLPFVGGLFDPKDGLFPKYDSGIYTQDTTQMVVSRGIGNSIIPLRFNNRPEIVVIELKK